MYCSNKPKDARPHKKKRDGQGGKRELYRILGGGFAGYLFSTCQAAFWVLEGGLSHRRDPVTQGAPTTERAFFSSFLAYLT